MTPDQITFLGEVAAKAAVRAIRKADLLGRDQNRGQFVSMVASAVKAIPVELRGEAVLDFLENEAEAPYGTTPR